MMIVLMTLSVSDLPTLERWFEDDELRRRMGGMLPLRAWFDRVVARPEPGHFIWVAYEQGVAVGLVDVEVESRGTAWLGVLVGPMLRHRGYCRRILRAVLMRPELAGVTVFKADIEADNVASIRCVEAVGFVRQRAEPDEEGFIPYVYRSG